MSSFETLGLAAGWLIFVFIGLLGVMILWRIADGSIDLSSLLSEPNGDASISRFQLLVFTFVVGICLFLVTIYGKDGPKLPDIPGTVLSLLGISASSYLVSKGIQFSNDAGLEPRPSQVLISPESPTVRYGESVQLHAETVLTESDEVTWSIVAGLGTVDAKTGLFTAPTAKEADGAKHTTVRAISASDPSATDLAVINFA